MKSAYIGDQTLKKTKAGVLACQVKQKVKSSEKKVEQVMFVTTNILAICIQTA
jgi:hypothetical protein